MLFHCKVTPQHRHPFIHLAYPLVSFDAHLHNLYYSKIKLDWTWGTIGAQFVSKLQRLCPGEVLKSSPEIVSRIDDDQYSGRMMNLLESGG